QGILTSEEALHSEQKNVITRALGIQPDVAPDLTGPLQLKAGDCVLLCTDGVCGFVSDEQIQFALQTNPRDPQAVADFLIQAANAAGGCDNATALVVYVETAAGIVTAPSSPVPPQPRDEQKQVVAKPLILLLAALGLL